MQECIESHHWCAWSRRNQCVLYTCGSSRRKVANEADQRDHWVDQRATHFSRRPKFSGRNGLFPREMVRDCKGEWIKFVVDNPYLQCTNNTALLPQYYEEIGKPTPKVEVMKYLKSQEYTDAKDYAGECESVVMIAKGQSKTYLQLHYPSRKITCLEYYCAYIL